MAKQSPSLYSVAKTFIWFAVVSILLTGCLVAMVLMDHNREWKVWQKKFIALKVGKAQQDLKKASQSVDSKKLESLQKALEDAERAFQSRRAEYQKISQGSDKINSRILKVRAEYQSLKQYEDSYKYYLEETRLHKDPASADYESKLKDVSPRVENLKDRLDELEKEKEAQDQRSSLLLEDQKKAQKELDALLAEKTRIEKQIKKIEPTLVKDVLNAPMLDFIAPSLQVQQIVLEDLQDDYHFTKVQKVDRCTTCHQGIDQKGFEDAPQPFRTHPKLDLYLGSLSPHPLEKIGCTSCHGGSGQAVSFTETAHTPRDEEQKEAWSKKYRWHEFEHWENKMLPLQHIEASCTKCHHQTVGVPQADKLNRGRKLAETYGCFNCHKIKGYEGYWKVGPDLTNVKGKLREEWVSKWLESPKDFRPSTKMPRVFHLSNTSSPEDKLKNEAAISSITAYLMKNSGAPDLSKPPVEGDTARGEKLVTDLGCLGCHSTSNIKAGDFAPELSGLGSKVSPEWLYSWLKHPKHLSSATRMPDLRLSDAEAADITAYLLSLKNELFDQKPAIRADMGVVDEMILEQLQSTMRRSEAEAQLKKMSGDERLQFLGKKSIAHQGCFSCHAIQGFGDELAPIGADLSDEGRKDIHKFDFGFIELEKTRQDWIRQKLKDPRSFDQGKIKAYYEKLRMPQFDLSEEEIEALTTFVLSLSEEQVPLQMQRRLDLTEKDIEKGRLLTAKLNCAGCHTLDGSIGKIREITQDPGAAPPVLDGEGAKVQEKWLHEFLKAPEPIRPWLTYRMPTFGLSEEDLRTLVFYFHHLAKQEVTFGGVDIPASEPESLAAGKTLFETFQCVKCHQVTQDSAAMGSSFLAPDLGLTKDRLKPEWVKDWLRDPQVLQAETMMPTFFSDGQSPMTEILGGDAEKQITAIRDHLYRYESNPGSKDENKKPVAK